MTEHRAESVEQLRAAGLRITAPRIATLDWLAGHPHATAEQVAAGVRGRLGTVSTQAIYDVLHACTQRGLLRRIEPAGHPARFETAPWTTTTTSSAGCADAPRTSTASSAPCRAPSDTSGFVVAEAEVVFWGLCPDCTHNRKGTT